MPRVARVSRDSGEIGEGDYFDPYRRFCERLPRMIQEAQNRRHEAFAQSRNAKKHKPNYRDFYVGSSMFAVDIEWRAELEFSAHNTMPSRWGPRVCAEKRVVERLEKEKRIQGSRWEAIGAVIIGEPQEDRATGIDPETLWACGETCVPGVLPKLPDDMLIVTLRPDLRKGQVQTAWEMRTFYEAIAVGDDPSEPPLFHRGIDDWAQTVERYDVTMAQSVGVPELDFDRSQVAREAARAAIQRPNLSVA